MYQQDRQCTHNVTLKRVYEIIVAVESNKFTYIWACVRARARARASEEMRMRACVLVCVEWGRESVRAPACASARVGLLIQYATRRCHTACVLSGFAIFFDIISQTA